MTRTALLLAAAAAGAAILTGCDTHSNGAPIVYYTAAPYGCTSTPNVPVCKRWLRTDGQRVQGNNEAYAAEVASKVAVGLCASRYGYTPAGWYTDEPVHLSGCHEPEGWATAPDGTIPPGA